MVTEGLEDGGHVLAGFSILNSFHDESGGDNGTSATNAGGTVDNDGRFAGTDSGQKVMDGIADLRDTTIGPVNPLVVAHLK